MFGTTAIGASGFVLACMHKRSIRIAAVLAVAIVTALAGADRPAQREPWRSTRAGR